MLTVKSKQQTKLIDANESTLPPVLPASNRHEASCQTRNKFLNAINSDRLPLWLLTATSFFLSYCIWAPYMRLSLPLWYMGKQGLLTPILEGSSFASFVAFFSAYSFLAGWSRIKNAKKEALFAILPILVLSLIGGGNPLTIFQYAQTYLAIPAIVLFSVATRHIGRLASERSSALTRRMVNHGVVLTSAVMLLLELILSSSFKYSRPSEVNIVELVAVAILPSLLTLCRLPCRNFRTAAQFGLVLQFPLVLAAGVNILVLSVLGLLIGAADTGYLQIGTTLLQGEFGLALKVASLVVLSCPFVLSPLLAAAIAVKVNQIRFQRLQKRNA